MEHMIHESQNGFVPGRVIHDTIDVFYALQKLVRAGTAPRDAIALFLDFKKAYDSLDSNFLRRALMWHQLPTQFIDIIMSLHSHTTASFLANGYASYPVDMENGIRQGCSLAPMLFILAVELFVRAIHADPRCTGIALCTPAATMNVPVAANADDLTLFLRNPRDEKHFLRMVIFFGSAPRSHVNPQQLRGHVSWSSRINAGARCKSKWQESRSRCASLGSKYAVPTTLNMRGNIRWRRSRQGWCWHA